MPAARKPADVLELIVGFPPAATARRVPDFAGVGKAPCFGTAVVRSQISVLLSAIPEAKVLPSAANPKALTSGSRVGDRHVSFPVSTSHTKMVVRPAAT